MKEQINIRYLKKHKVPIIAVSALTVMLIFIAIFAARSNKVRQREQAAALEAQEQALEGQEQSVGDKEQLNDASEYLKEIDATITTNTEHLAEASLLQMEAGKTLTGFSENLTKMEESLACIENLINRQAEKQAGESSEILLSITALSDSQKEIRSQIMDANTSITSILADMKAGNEGNFTSAFEKLKGLQDTLAEVGKNAEGYYKSLDSLITLLQKENQEGHKELTDALLAAKEEISGLMDNGFASMELQMEQDLAALMEQMGSLHRQIVGTEGSITALLRLMEENDAGRQEEIREAFDAVSVSLGQIKEDYTDAHTEISSLIQKLGEAENANHEETLSVLTVMESNMAENSIENLTRITNSLHDMEESFSASISNMQGEMTQNFSSLSDEMTQNMSEYNSSINDMFNRLDTNITNHYQDLSTTVNNYDKGQQESLDNLLGFLEQKLQQVFQYVSDGKRKLASALLTKGVTVREDATFEEIYQAILAIPQKLVIGVQEIPGTIEYEYHYHTDGNGNTPHASTSGAMGGCYTSPIYHTHSGNSSSGGGCYTVAKTGYRTYGCGSADCSSGPHGPDSSGNVYYVGSCDRCGKTISVYGAPRRVACDNTTTVKYTYYELGCGKSTSTVTGYRPACGLSDGQITGAHIVYDRSAVPAASALSMETYPAYDGAGEGSPFVETVLEENMEAMDGATGENGTGTEGGIGSGTVETPDNGEKDNGEESVDSENVETESGEAEETPDEGETTDGGADVPVETEAGETTETGMGGSGDGIPEVDG